MGILDFLFRGGNVRKTAKAIADRHNELGGDPSLVATHLSLILTEHAYEASHRGNMAVWALLQLRGGQVSNYVELACLVLWAGGAPRGYSFEQCKRAFSQELTKYFDEYGVTAEYVTGNIAARFAKPEDPELAKKARNAPPP